MNYAIMRMQKISSLNTTGIGNHIDRSSGGKLSIPKNINKQDILNNIHWDKNGKSYTQKEWTEYTKINPFHKRIEAEIKTRYTNSKKIRKDAVRAIEYILTSDNDKMTEIFNDKILYKSWIKDNRDFLAEIYGKDNIVSLHLHLDETSPHLHAVIVPITQDGRLSAKSFVDGRKMLSNQQTRYAEIMSKYGMKRGEFGSTARHKKIKPVIKKQSKWER